MSTNNARALLLDNGWSDSTLDVWRRANGRCEYCGKDLQAHSDDYFYGYNVDHVVPASRGGSDDLDNYALACRACNLIKRNQDFRIDTGPNGRDDLVARAKQYIGAERARNDRRMHDAMPWLQTLGLRRP